MKKISRLKNSVLYLGRGNPNTWEAEAGGSGVRGQPGANWQDPVANSSKKKKQY
jgi:hypothetical protein